MHEPKCAGRRAPFSRAAKELSATAVLEGGSRCIRLVAASRFPCGAIAGLASDASFNQADSLSSCAASSGFRGFLDVLGNASASTRRS